MSKRSLFLVILVTIAATCAIVVIGHLLYLHLPNRFGYFAGMASIISLPLAVSSFIITVVGSLVVVLSDKHRKPENNAEYLHLRSLLLNKVDGQVKNFLQQSEHSESLEIDKTFVEGKVSSPLNFMLNKYTYRDTLFAFRESVDSMLILGESGCGKTTELMMLARKLSEEARKDETKPVPVLFELQSWKKQKKKPRPKCLQFLLKPLYKLRNLFTKAKKQAPFESWLVEKFQRTYQFNKSIGKDWLKKKRLYLLLDGLDDIQEEQHRIDCVDAINEFLETGGAAGIAICSQPQAYEQLQLPRQLRLNGAIRLQPLSNKQTHDYLKEVGNGVLTSTLMEDGELQELVRTPLILSTMSEAFEEISSQAALGQLIELNTKEEKRAFIFDAYIEKVFQRRKKKRNNNSEDAYSKESTLKWLSWLAKILRDNQVGNTIYIEDLQPLWLGDRLWIYRLIYGASVFFPIILAYLLAAILHSSIRAPLLLLYFGFILAVWRAYLDTRIETVEVLAWDRKAGLKGLTKWFSIGFVLFFTLLLTLSTANGLPLSFLILVASSFLGGVVFATVNVGIGLKKEKATDKTSPNKGIYLSAQNFIRVIVRTTVFWVLLPSFMMIFLSLIFFSFFNEAVFTVTDILIGTVLIVWFSIPLGIVYGSFGLILALNFLPDFGGKTVLQHFALRRAILYLKYGPRNYAHFLDFTTKLGLTRRNGGSYTFRHNLLFEHLAMKHLEFEKGAESMQFSENYSNGRSKPT